MVRATPVLNPKDHTPWSLVWLASYPKSGNTWFRVFLTNYLRGDDQPALINQLESAPIASDRLGFDRLYGIDSADLDWAEIDQRRPAVYQQWQTDSPWLFHKVHDAYTYLPDGQPLLGLPHGQAAIYLIRNPLDVAVSFAHHSGQAEVDKTITRMGQTQAALANQRSAFDHQLRQQLLSWSEHVQSWQNAPLPKLILRYEDLLADPFATFSQAIRFLQLPDEPERIRKAIAFSDFSVLREQEQTLGFKEKTSVAKQFFRQGKAGGYREVLTEAQIQRVQQDHAVVMREWGYSALCAE